MAVKRFSWSNFDYEFVKSIVYCEKTPKKLKPAFELKFVDELCPYMEDICPYPDEAFVKRYRDEIHTYFLKDSNHLVRIVSKLEKLNYGGMKVGENEEMLHLLSKKRLSQTVLDCYVKELRMAGKQIMEDDESLFKSPKTIDLTTAGYAEVPIYPYQEQAVSAMKEYFLYAGHDSGLIAMPTGSGKTRTSIYFLLKELISRGYQVLWLAHRSMLLEQAAEQFYKFSPLIKGENPAAEEFKMVCISGKHASVHAMEKSSNLIISSVQTLCNKTMYLPNILADKVIIVVDEAHHTLAPSYRRIINAVRKCRPNAKLLGLTATPVRLKDKDTKALMHIYEDKPIFSVPMSKLITEKILSTPIHIPVETNLDIRTLINIDEQKYIKKWGEMPDSLVTKVAKTNERNELIVDEYIQNKDKYGKTIIFALNAIHCDTLNEMFRKKGIRSGYVYTLNDSAENQSIIERFKHNDRPDGIDVLININILTEGSDIPDVQTVFLTRPTSSDVLLMQMVGRGMRGTGCGGTETVHVVDFCDKWYSIARWMNPQFILGEQMGDFPEIYRKTVNGSLIPMEMIRDIAKGITYQTRNSGKLNINRNICLPVGWYDINDEDGNDIKILVYENQLTGYEEFKTNFEFFMKNDRLGAKEVYRAFFRGLDMQPLEEDIENMVFYLKSERVFPEFYSFKTRDKIDPYLVAKDIKEKDLSFSAYDAYLKDIFEQNSSIISELYDSFEYYKKRVTDYVMYEGGNRPLGIAVEEPEKRTYKLSSASFKKSLDELLTAVMEEQKANLPEDFIRPAIYWTDRSYAGYFGKYTPARNEILINSLLNSTSVPEEVLKFLIYHECLHQHISGHPKEFYEKEFLYPKSQEWNHYLDYQFPNFEIDDSEEI